MQAVSLSQLALVLLLPVLCFGWQANLFLFGIAGAFLGSVAALGVISLACGAKAKRLVPILACAGIVFLCGSICFLVQSPNNLPRWIPSHWALYVPLMGRLLLGVAGAIAAFCSALSFSGESFPSKSLERPKLYLLLGLLMLCFIWGILFEGFWFVCWLIPANYVLLSAIFAFCLYVLSALICKKLLELLFGNNDRNNASVVAALAISFLAAGQLSWGLLNRLCGSISWTLETSAVCLILILLLDVSVFVAIHQAPMNLFCDPEPYEKCKNDGSRLVELFALSDREAQALVLKIEGLTSEESAEKMGVKPPTVRTYLQRAYKKIGLQDTDDIVQELRNSYLSVPSDLKSAEGKDENLVDLPSHSFILTSNVRNLLSALLLLSFSLFVGLVLVPHISFFGDTAWRVSQLHSLLVGFALALSGGFVFGLRRIGVTPRQAGEIVQASFVSLRHTKKATVVVGVLLVLFLLSSLISFELWLGMMLVSFILFIVCSIALHASNNSIDNSSVSVDAFDLMSSNVGSLRFGAISILFALCGYIFEDAWRPATDDFTWWIQTAFLVVLLLYLASKVRNICFICISLVLATLFAVGLACGIRIVLLALIFAFWVSIVVEGKIDLTSNDFPLYVAIFGLTMLLARWLTDAWWDQMSYGYVSAVTHGGFWLTGAIVPAFEFLFIVAALGALVYLILSEQTSKKLCDFEIDEESVSLYFASRGLTPLESDVLVKLVQGKTGPQAAQELHYAVGTINSARWSAYRKLGIHSRDELLRLLESNRFAIDSSNDVVI